MFGELPPTRNGGLEYLRAQRASIDAEIEAIESREIVQVYHPSQIRERFQTAVNLLKDLQSDFRAVEERFQSIARDVLQLQASGNDSRGGISDTPRCGRYAQEAGRRDQLFCLRRFSVPPAQQTMLLKTFKRSSVWRIGRSAGIIAARPSMVPALLAEADKVMRTTARLSSTLRRLLDARAAADRVRLANVLRDIRKAALARGEASVHPDHQMVVDAEIEIASPLPVRFGHRPLPSPIARPPSIHLM